MNGFELYFDIITLACGVYCLYTTIKLKTLGKLFPNQLLIPKDAKPEHCIDEEGYIAYIWLRLLIVGILCVAAGITSLAENQTGMISAMFPQIANMGFYVVMGGILLCIVAVGWYMACWMKARKLFWV